MRFEYDDGGREQAGYRGTTGDCTCRAIAIATGQSYEDVYYALNRNIKARRQTKRVRGSSARTGVPKRIIHDYLALLGWEWVPTMGIGTGCKVHLRDGELPMGSLIVNVSHHMVAVIDGVIRDTHDCSRGGSRCVYGYWTR